MVDLSSGIWGCPQDQDDPFSALVALFTIMFKPHCIIAFIIEFIIAQVFDAIADAIAPLFLELIIDVPTPEPASGPIAWETTSAASNAPWPAVYSQNAEFATAGIMFVALGGAIAMALGAIRAIPNRTKNKVYRRTVIGGVFLVFNRPFLALYLEFANAMHRVLGQVGSASLEDCVEYYMFSIFTGGVVGAVGLIVVLNVTVIPLIAAIVIIFLLYLAIQFMIDLLIYVLFMFAPLFIAGWAVAHGPLQPVGKKAKKGLNIFATVAMANWPALMIWRAGCVLFGVGADDSDVGNNLIDAMLPAGNSFGTLGDGAQGLVAMIFGIMFITMGIYVTAKWTMAGQMVMSGIGGAVKVAAVGAAGGGAAAGLAASGAGARTAMKLGEGVSKSAESALNFNSSPKSWNATSDEKMMALGKSGVNRAASGLGLSEDGPFDFDYDGFSDDEIDSTTGEYTGDPSSVFDESTESGFAEEYTDEDGNPDFEAIQGAQGLMMSQQMGDSDMFDTDDGGAEAGEGDAESVGEELENIELSAVLEEDEVEAFLGADAAENYDSTDAYESDAGDVADDVTSGITDDEATRFAEEADGWQGDEGDATADDVSDFMKDTVNNVDNGVGAAALDTGERVDLKRNVMKSNMEALDRAVAQQDDE